MAKCLVLSVGLVKENYSKNDILEYLKDEILKVAFEKLIVFASEKTTQSGLNEFFDYLKKIKVEFTVFPGEDYESLGYVNEIMNASSVFVDEGDSMLVEVLYVSGFFVIELMLAQTEEEEEEFKKNNVDYRKGVEKMFRVGFNDRNVF
jgi:hypothetical protein